MNYIRTSLLTAVCLVASTPAFGQATRTWVSGVGDDVNPCSRTAPCKTFAGAISKTATGGEINVIDPGGFGTLTITKSLTLDGLGPMSSILSVGTTGIVINGAGAVVNIRNITINGANSTTGNGIRIVNAATVNIENVTFENFSGTGTNGRGLTIETTTADVRVNVRNSRFLNSNNFAIESTPTGGNVVLTVDDTGFLRGAASAIVLRRLTTASINRSTITGYGGAAVSLDQTGTSAQVSNSFFANNGYGIFNGDGAGGAPITRLYGTVITGSTIGGVTINAGQVISYGNNGIRGNVGPEAVSSSTGTQ